MIVYYSLKDSPKEVAALTESAQEKVREARLLIENGFYNSAVSSSYYALLNISRAALRKRGIVPKTHAGVLTMFGKEFKDGKIESMPVELLRFYRQVKRLERRRTTRSCINSQSGRPSTSAMLRRVL